MVATLNATQERLSESLASLEKALRDAEGRRQQQMKINAELESLREGREQRITEAVRAATSERADVVAKLERKREGLENEQRSVEAALATSRAQLEEITKAISPRSCESPGRLVHINVGGCVHQTTTTTLCRCGGYFQAMFSGRFDLVPAANGAFFIDRDGSQVWRILSFLRTGDLPMPEDSDSIAELRREADFYGIVPILRILDGPSYARVSSLSD
jgi:hypothetical protein